jgi:hypothetical protein
MTRRRILLALLVVTAAVAVLIPVLMRPRAADVEIKFAGYGTNGAALVRLENRSGRRIAVGRLITFEPGEKRVFVGAWQNTPLVLPPRAVTFKAVPDGQGTSLHISPPPKVPWRAQVEYVDVDGLAVKIRHLLVQARVILSKPLVLQNVTSEVITNAPPVP